MVQIPILNGIYTDNGPDFRTSYPVNMVAVPKTNGISEGFLRPADGIVANGTGPGQSQRRPVCRSGDLTMSATALYARLTPGFAERMAQTLAMLESAASTHADAIVQATSLGAEDMVLTDLIARHALPVVIATLETGQLHRETTDLITTITRHYGLALEVYRPQAEAVLQFVATQGEAPMFRSLALRKACCGLRKMEPLARMLGGHQAWITGLRREQSQARGGVPFQEIDDAGRVKLNPLANWSWADVWH